MRYLTIFTPTYNREYELGLLYESLKSQSCHDFLWLIVDDGSVDNTRQRVQCWIEEEQVDIQYLYQENQGKHVAMKTAIEICSTAWFICVDSVDLVPPDGVRKMLADISCELPKGCIGYIYPQYMPKEYGVMRFPEGLSPIHIMEARSLYHVFETAILFQTKYLKMLECPQFSSERFMSEDAFYIPIAQFGKFVPKNQLVYESAYRDDGLTRNIFQIWIKNPKGTIYILKLRYKFWKEYGLYIRVRERVKCIMNLNAFCMKCDIPVFATTSSKVYSAVLWLPSIAWRAIRFS